MGDLKFTVDINQLSKQLNKVQEEVQSEIVKAVGNLAKAANEKVRELASEKLKSSSKKFNDALTFEEITTNVWVITLDETMAWREDGLESYDMKPGLLKNGAKTSKSGNKYKSIPFSHGSGKYVPSNSKSSQFISLLKTELKKRNIPYKNIEMGHDGQPKLGKLHTIKDINSPRPTKSSSKGIYHGLNVYQTKNSKGSIDRSFMTFRTVSDGPASNGKFIHPGISGAKIFDEVLAWVEGKWDQEILPNLLDRFKN
jgi:hypothetical protein